VVVEVDAEHGDRCPGHAARSTHRGPVIRAEHVGQPRRRTGLTADVIDLFAALNTATGKVGRLSAGTGPWPSSGSRLSGRGARLLRIIRLRRLADPCVGGWFNRATIYNSREFVAHHPGWLPGQSLRQAFDKDVDAALDSARDLGGQHFECVAWRVSITLS
jgi:hypothetical protein